MLNTVGFTLAQNTPMHNTYMRELLALTDLPEDEVERLAHKLAPICQRTENNRPRSFTLTLSPDNTFLTLTIEASPKKGEKRGASLVASFPVESFQERLQEQLFEKHQFTQIDANEVAKKFPPCSPATFTVSVLPTDLGKRNIEVLSNGKPVGSVTI